ncbi:UNVERIFIED_CONTAM: hypothetical protein RMT77_014418 [Armadillidium vulgare]
MASLLKKLFNNKKVKRFVVYEAFQISRRNIFKSSRVLLNTEYPNANVKSPIYMLGIETSCDDTGAAVVNEKGQILGEGYYSQVEASVKFGGVVPSLAEKYHKENIDKAVTDALEKSSIKPTDLTAVAVTVKPGNKRTLRVGYNYGKKFALQHNLPFIPIHHMEAHALTVRMENKVEFPFVVLLISGGHCVLCIAHSINEWSILGETGDSPPGVAVDQVARRMKIRNLPGLSSVIGGKAIEILAKEGDPKKFAFPVPNQKHRDPSFSFSGLETSAKELIIRLELEKGIEGGNVLDNVNDICASFQYSFVNHLVRKTQLGFKFAELTKRIPPQNKTLVASGGVASNQFLRDSFKILCEAEGYRLLIPPPKLCTDNGVMIAWNGIEKWNMGLDILRTEKEISSISIENKCPLGPNLTEECRAMKIPKFKYVKLV